MKILALDSSGNVASVAIATEEQVIAEYTTDFKKTHSQTLLPMLDELVKCTGLDLKELDAIAVAAGPGSFTGLRIGSATGKGLAQVLEKPVIPVPTLEGLAYNLYGYEHWICPIMDARKDQVYTAVYHFAEENGEKCLQVIREQKAMSIEQLCSFLNGQGKKVAFLGDGVPVHQEYLKQQLQTEYLLYRMPFGRQRASSVALRAFEYLKAGRVQQAKEHRPEYLRVPQAERERKERIEHPDWNKMSSGRLTKELILYRTMEEADLSQVAQLEESIFSEPWSQDAFRDAMKKPSNLYVVAEKEGEILGYCGIWGVAGEGQISNVAVKESERGQKIGYELLSRSIEEMKKRNHTAFTLEVRAGNQAALALYQKLGFLSEGIRPGFYCKPEEDAVIMWLREA